jgi:hypothetical protein
VRRLQRQRLENDQIERSLHDVNTFRHFYFLLSEQKGSLPFLSFLRKALWLS